MVSPPVVMSRGRPVGGALHIAIVGLFVLAGPIATPPVPTVLIHFIMESVVDLSEGKCAAVRTQASRSKETLYPGVPFTCFEIFHFPDISKVPF